jgi:hypothetical protein
MTRLRSCSVVLTGVLVVGGCAYGLHPHQTLEGRAYPAVRIGEVQKGMTEAQVEGVLGAPLEVGEDAGFVTWRYFERAQLRGCRQSFLWMTLADAPVVTTQAKIYFTAGIVGRVESSGGAGRGPR